jgi:Tol biopolymer transport system component
LADGEYKILFRDQAGAALGDFFLINLDGTGLTNLTNSPDHDEFYPTWDPNAARFAAQVYPCASGCTPHLYEFTLGMTNGAPTMTGVTDLTETGSLRDAYVFKAQWGRTQDRIVVNARLLSDANNSDLWIIDLVDPANPFRLTRTASVSELSPSWAPDDSKIVYQRNVPTSRKSKERPGIFVISPDGSGASGEGYPKFGIDPDWRRCCPTCATVCAP